jgi:hypothetical protein
VRTKTILTGVTALAALALGCSAPPPPPPAATKTSDASSFTSTQLAERTQHRRAVEAVIWGVPAVNFDVMYQAMVRDAKAGEGSNKIVYWSRLFDWKNQTLTPNPDAIYLMAFYDTKEVGPVVLEIPPSGEGIIVGSIDDCWQTALEDVGPAGVDKGKGGKYLVLPPDFKGKAPPGYIVLPSGNYQGYALLRSNPKSGSDADITRAVEYGKKVKLYPLSQAANPSATTFVDAAGVLYEANLPYDLRFFQSLDRIVQKEPWLTRDKVMIDKLKSIGIEKGKPFDPDAKTREILESAVAEAHAWLVNNYETAYFPPPLNPGTSWTSPGSHEVFEGMMTHFSNPDSYPVDGRGTAYTIGFFSAKHLGKGQFYLMTFKDKAGRSLEGGNTYRLNVPANAPVNQYWSVTAYDRATHGLIRDTQWSSRSSNTTGLQKNADGSVDVYFGPKPPTDKESNWVPTKTNGQFEALFRFYGPEQPLFDKTWKLPDIEEVP